MDKDFKGSHFALGIAAASSTLWRGDTAESPAPTFCKGKYLRVWQTSQEKSALQEEGNAQKIKGNGSENDANVIAIGIIQTDTNFFIHN